MGRLCVAYGVLLYNLNWSGLCSNLAGCILFQNQVFSRSSLEKVKIQCASNLIAHWIFLKVKALSRIWQPRYVHGENYLWEKKWNQAEAKWPFSVTILSGPICSSLIRSGAYSDLLIEDVSIFEFFWYALIKYIEPISFKYREVTYSWKPFVNCRYIRNL
jgi:hypothetical protein